MRIKSGFVSPDSYIDGHFGNISDLDRNRYLLPNSMLRVKGQT